MKNWRRLIWCLIAGMLLVVLLGCNGGDDGESGSLATASLTVTPSVGTDQTLYVLTAKALDSSGKPVKPIQTSWDWENDGVDETPFINQASVERVYDTPGTYTVRVTVKDASGQMVSAQQEIQVAEDPNPMVVSLSVSPETGTTQTDFVFEAQAFEFLGPLSVRDQLVPMGYVRWDWEDDGVFDTPFIFFEMNTPPDEPSKAPIIEHRFATPGVRQVRVQLKRLDPEASYGTATVTVSVTE
ncbi:MAG: PKD domain-containing protein [Armatimonadota bacterium]